jgi:hypothetical protein
MKKCFVFFVILMACSLFITTFSNQAYAFEIGARGYYWFPTLKTDMKVDGGSLKGTEFNVKDDLGLGYKPYPSIEVFAGLGKQHLSLMYTQADYSDSTKLTKPIAFNGTTFAAGTSVDSSLKIRMIDVAYKVDIIDTGNILAGFSVSAIGKLKYIDGDASITAGGLQASNKFRAPIPMVGAAAHIGILANILEARAEITGIAYSGNSLYEALADLSLTPFPFLDIHGGYKIIAIRIDQNDTYFNGQIAGPYLALTVSF